MNSEGEPKCQSDGGISPITKPICLFLLSPHDVIHDLINHRERENPLLNKCYDHLKCKKSTHYRVRRKLGCLFYNVESNPFFFIFDLFLHMLEFQLRLSICIYFLRERKIQPQRRYICCTNISLFICFSFLPLWRCGMA